MAGTPIGTYRYIAGQAYGGPAYAYRPIYDYREVGLIARKADYVQVLVEFAGNLQWINVGLVGHCQDEVHLFAEEAKPGMKCLPGVSWTVSTEQEWEEKYVAKHGRVEYERRLKVADDKADQLEDWEERMFMRAQFRSLAMQLGSTTKMETVTADKIVLVICKLAGV